MKLSKEHVLVEIKRLAEESGGKAPGQKRFASSTGIQEHDWRRYWARWTLALQEAGFQPNQWNEPLGSEAVLSRLVLEVRRLRRMPTGRERDLIHREDATFPSEGVFRRMGSRRDLVGMLADYCRGHPEYGDVLVIVEPLLTEEETAVPDRDSGEPSDFGFVYLLKSGRNYKVGRTNSVGRREYELRIQLPERATLVHQITTDDPAGIEAYWHRRFADRRKGGEWFELTAADVSAFKRRKFM